MRLFRLLKLQIEEHVVGSVFTEILLQLSVAKSTAGSFLVTISIFVLKINI